MHKNSSVSLPLLVIWWTLPGGMAMASPGPTTRVSSPMPHLCLPGEEIIDFFRHPVIVRRGTGAGGRRASARLCCRIDELRVRQQFANLRTVFGDERRNLSNVMQVHRIVPARSFASRNVTLRPGLPRKIKQSDDRRPITMKPSQRFELEADIGNRTLHPPRPPTMTLWRTRCRSAVRSRPASSRPAR